MRVEWLWHRHRLLLLYLSRTLTKYGNRRLTRLLIHILKFDLLVDLSKLLIVEIVIKTLSGRTHDDLLHLALALTVGNPLGRRGY